MSTNIVIYVYLQNFKVSMHIHVHSIIDVLINIDIEI